MAAKRRSRKDLYSRLMSYIEDCGNQARSAIEEMMNEDCLDKYYKKQYRLKLRRVERLIEDCTSNVVRWKYAIRNVELEYYIQLNALYKAMMTEFEFFEIKPDVICDIEAELERISKMKKWDPKGNVYQKTMADYSESINTIARDMMYAKVMARAKSRKYGQFDVKAWNVQIEKVFDEDFTSNDVFNSYKLDSLTSRRSFSYIKNLVSLSLKFPSVGEDGYSQDLYLMSYTTPQAMVSIKMNMQSKAIYAEIRIYDATQECGYKEAFVDIEMQTDMYKLYEQFGFTSRQRKDASLKYARIFDLVESYEE